MKNFALIALLSLALAGMINAQTAKAKTESCCDAAMKAVAVQKADDCCADEAKAVKAQVEGKEECCKSTDAKPVAKGEKGCCNAKGELAKFKVFVSGKGYQFFGCEGSAKKGREEWMTKGAVVGKVQKVTHKKNIA